MAAGDFLNRTIQIGRAKTSGGTGRVIPINDELFTILERHHRWFVETFRQSRAEDYVFPWGAPIPKDPSRHVLEVKTAWTKARQRAKVSCRLHDLRHTYATQLAELGTPESTMLALMGCMSRRMLEHYSHIRMAAKRQAVQGVTLRPKRTEMLELIPVKVPVLAENQAVQ